MSGIQGKMASYPYGFANGVSVRGMPVVNTHTNTVVYVDSNHGNDGNNGSIGTPVATVQGAINLLSNNSSTSVGRIGNTLNGCIIMCKPYHAETLTAATTYSLAGCAIIGNSFGDGDVPTFTLTTAAAAGIVLGAADMLLKDIKIIDNVGATACITLSAKGCRADGCEIYDGSASYTTGILVNGGGANKADRCAITNNLIYSAGATQAILLNEVEDKVVISNNTTMGAYSTGIIQNPTSTVMTNLMILSNALSSTTSNSTTVHLVSSCTGIISSNTINSAGTATKTIGSLISTGNNNLSAATGAAVIF